MNEFDRMFSEFSEKSRSYETNKERKAAEPTPRMVRQESDSEVEEVDSEPP